MDNALYQELDARERSLHFAQDMASDAREALRAIIAARDLAPDAPIHTPLMCAIEAARRIVE